MPVIRISSLLDDMFGSVQTLADRLRFIRDSSGDLSSRIVFNAIWSDIGQLKRTQRALRDGAQGHVQEVNDALSSFIGSPATASALNNTLVNINSEIDNFQTGFRSWFVALSATDVMDVVQLSTGNGDTFPSLELAVGIPQVEADVLRAIPELTDLIDAIELIGAT